MSIFWINISVVLGTDNIEISDQEKNMFWI